MRLRQFWAVGSIFVHSGCSPRPRWRTRRRARGATGATGNGGAIAGVTTGYGRDGGDRNDGNDGEVGGATGSTGATGTIPTPPPIPRAPITLAKGQSPSAVYAGPVYVAEPGGAIVPYAPQTTIASVAGGTVAGTLIGGLPHLVVPGDTAEIVHGLAAAPENAPAVVQHIIWAANKIIGRPYVYGGGHQSFLSRGYDCSGTVSFALHGGSLLSSPLDSSQFMSWAGPARAAG